MELLRSPHRVFPDRDRIISRKEIPKQVPPSLRSDYACYRKLIYLKNNRRVLLRFLTEEDRDDLISLFQDAAAEDLQNFKRDLKNQRLLHDWLDHLDYQRLLPLITVDLNDHRLIAAATLLRGKHAAHHIGEIKLFIARPYRNLGLGSKMLDELIQFASQEKLHWVKAEVATDQKQLIKALRSKGFQIRATLEDFILRQDGATQDVVLMMRSVNQAPDDL